MPSVKHKLMIAYLEISDWVKNFKDFDKLSKDVIKNNLINSFKFSHISEEDQNLIIKSIIDLFKAIKK